jgi:hypothetical protein
VFVTKYNNLYVFFWVFPRRFIQPLKMDLTEGSETSAKLNLTPGKYPKENIHVSEHGENLKSRKYNKIGNACVT